MTSGRRVKKKRRKGKEGDEKREESPQGGGGEDRRTVLLLVGVWKTLDSKLCVITNIPTRYPSHSFVSLRQRNEGDREGAY